MGNFAESRRSVAIFRPVGITVTEALTLAARAAQAMEMASKKMERARGEDAMAAFETSAGADLAVLSWRDLHAHSFALRGADSSAPMSPVVVRAGAGDGAMSRIRDSHNQYYGTNL
jgi:hypothetical protein